MSKEQQYRDTLLCAMAKGQSMIMSALAMQARDAETAAHLEFTASNLDYVWRGVADKLGVLVEGLVCAEDEDELERLDAAKQRLYSVNRDLYRYFKAFEEMKLRNAKTK